MSFETHYETHAQVREAWVCSVSGARWDLIADNLNLDDVKIEDIAWSLSQLPRFGGHLQVRGYSVCHHSLNVCAHVVRECGETDLEKVARLALTALLHDMVETFGFGDIISPAKGLLRHCYDQNVAPLEEKLHNHFGTIWPLPEIIRRVDGNVCVTEHRDWGPPGPHEWHASVGAPYDNLPFGPSMPGDTVTWAFLRQVERLKEKIA